MPKGRCDVGYTRSSIPDSCTKNAWEVMSETREGHAGDLADAQLVLTGIWAARLVQGRQVLDASSLIGPATRQLFATARELVVVTPRAAVADAIGDLVSSRVRAYCSTFAHLPFEKGSFGAVVALQVPNTNNLDGLVAEFSRVLEHESGMLVVSPGVDASGQSDPGALDQLLHLLDSRFANVTTITCSTYLTGGFFSADSPPFSLENPPHGILGERHPATGAQSPDNLVVGSPVPLDSSLLPTQISIPFEITRLQMSLRQLNSLVRTYESRAREAGQMADDNARLLRELFAAEQVVAEAFDQRAQRQGSALLSTGSDEELAQIRQQLSDARAHIDALQATVSWRVTRPLRMVRRSLK